MFLTLIVLDLLEKYGLKKYDYSKSSLSNNLLNGQDDRLTFADKKLQLMWTKAQKTGFSGMLTICLQCYMCCLVCHIEVHSDSY